MSDYSEETSDESGEVYDYENDIEYVEEYIQEEFDRIQSFCQERNNGLFKNKNAYFIIRNLYYETKIEE